MFPRSPHVELVSYTQDHPTSTEVVVRCQTNGQITAEHAVVEALLGTRSVPARVRIALAALARRCPQLDLAGPPVRDARLRFRGFSAMPVRGC